MIEIAWIIFAAVVIGLLILNFSIVQYYNDRNHSELFPTVVAVLALTLTLICIFLIPVDIYSVSTSQSEEIRNSIQILYIVIYCSVLSFAFGVIPFAWFYYEAYDPTSGSPLLKRIWDGFKYTIGVIVIVVILLIVGIFIRSPNEFNGTDPPSVWANKILAEGKAMATLFFTISCITIIGYVVWCSYTAYGLAALPIGLLKGKKTVKEEEREIQERIKVKRQQKESASEEVSREGLLEDEERALSKQADRLKSVKNTCYKIQLFCRPFAVIFGVIALLVSILIVISLCLTALDRTLNHLNCGATCGFILNNPEIFNPLDQLLIALSRVFPIDYIVLSVIVLYIYFCTLHAITDIGIRCFCLHMFTFRKNHTEPQALMMSSIILMLSTLALNNSIVTLAPTYAKYGSQMYIPSNSTNEEACSLSAPVDMCIMTQVGSIVHSVDINVGFFGIVFYAFTWLFAIAFIICIIIACVKSRKSNVETYSDDDEEEENW